MDVQDRRTAIYKVETAIEEALDTFTKDTDGLNISKIKIQSVYDMDRKAYPALKVNVIISSIEDKK